MRLRWRHLPLLPNPIHVRPLANVKVDAPAVAWSLAKERSMEAEVAGTDVTRTDQSTHGYIASVMAKGEDVHLKASTKKARGNLLIKRVQQNTGSACGVSKPHLDENHSREIRT
ncbi:hypothetical protein U9M48_029029 [Paspalum notatum var. saurae]|uniref:Uncharacterized protein n=1 Tax=Paspalum notatum var. saurae TaxID=547442 RepID=A0AAQ3TXV6_PASNO